MLQYSCISFVNVSGAFSVSSHFSGYVQREDECVRQYAVRGTLFVFYLFAKTSHEYNPGGMHAVCEPMANRRPCKPDFIGACCDTFGDFLTTAFSCHIPKAGSEKPIFGYCKAGDCVRHVCKKYSKDVKSIRSAKPMNRFCGASHSNPCKATCKFKSSNKCDDTAAFLDGGENLEDGAICLKDLQKGALVS